MLKNIQGVKQAAKEMTEAHWLKYHTCIPEIVGLNRDHCNCNKGQELIESLKKLRLSTMRHVIRMNPKVQCRRPRPTSDP